MNKSIILIFLFLSACSSKESENSPTPQAQVSVPVPTVSPTWTEKTSSASDGSVQVTQTQMTDAGQSSLRSTYQRVNLAQVPIDSKYNAVILKVTDETIPEDVHQAFIAPKLFSYAGSDDGRIVSYDNGDGTTTLSFNVAFVDGLVSQIPSPTSDRKISLPDKDVIQDRTALEADLANRFSLNQGIAPLAGCPKKIFLGVGSQEVDATSPELASGDFCQINIPLAISLTVKNDFAKWMLSTAIPAGLVDIRGVFETRVSFPVANVKLSFNRSQLYRSLEAELGVKAWVVDADARAAVSKVMQKQLLKVSVQGDLSAMLTALITQVTNEFFQPFAPVSSNSWGSGCGSSRVCLRLNFTQSQQNSDLEFDWVQSTNSITGQNYLTSTQLRSTPRKVTVGKPESCTDHCERLVNDGAPRELGLTVHSGDTLVLESNYIREESKQDPSPSVEREHHNVCLESSITANPMIVLTCKRSEDQWLDVTTYDSSSRFVLIEQPVGLIDQLYQGLSLQFERIDPESGTLFTKECPLSAFRQKGDGVSLQLQIEKTGACDPFEGDEKPVMLALVNRISLSETYLDGKRVVNWQGNTIQMPGALTFHPEVEWVGDVTVMND